jgi:hypothetical protein
MEKENRIVPDMNAEKQNEFKAIFFAFRPKTKRAIP